MTATAMPENGPPIIDPPAGTAHQVAPEIGPEVIAERSARVRMRIPNTPDSGVVWDDEEVPRIVGQTPLVTNRAYVLDKDRWGHVPLVNDEPVHALIVGAEAEDGAVLLHLVIDSAEIATLLTEYGDPCPGYAAHQFGWDAPRVCEVGPAKAPEPKASAKSGLELEQPHADLRAALKVVADGRAYTREHFSRPPTGYVGHTPAAEYDAAVDAIVAGLTDILDSTQSGPSPHADLREAIARALWARSDLDREENPDQFGKDGHRAFWYGQAEAVLPIVEAHVAAAVQQARAEEERDLEDAVRDRDETEAIADRLAYSIAPKEVIGEHSSGNFPWLTALELTPKGGWQAAVEQARAEGAAEALRDVLEAAFRAVPTVEPGEGAWEYGIRDREDGITITLDEAQARHRSSSGNHVGWQLVRRFVSEWEAAPDA